MVKPTLQDEIRRITNENAATTAAKALEVAELAKQKAADTAALALTEALKVSTLAATKAADAASAAAQIAASTSKDLEYIKKDITSMGAEVKAINMKLDDKYTTKEDAKIIESRVKSIEDNLSKAVWIVLTVVILAVLGLVIVKAV